MSWHPFGTYSHFSFDMLLKGSIYYKNPTYNSGIEQLSHPTVQSSFALISIIEIIFADFHKLILLIIQPCSCSYSSPCSYLSSAHVYCQSPMWLLKNVVVGCGTTFLVPTKSPTQPLPTDLYQLTVQLVFGEVLKPFGRFNLTLPITL